MESLTFGKVGEAKAHRAGMEVRFEPRFQGCHTLTQTDSHTLPEGEEDDGFDGEELEYRLKWSQEVLGSEVEKEQSVESQAN